MWPQLASLGPWLHPATPALTTGPHTINRGHIDASIKEIGLKSRLYKHNVFMHNVKPPQGLFFFFVPVSSTTSVLEVQDFAKQEGVWIHRTDSAIIQITVCLSFWFRTAQRFVNTGSVCEGKVFSFHTDDSSSPTSINLTWPCPVVQCRGT